MNGSIIRALIQKDLTIFFRNRFFAVVTMLGLVFFSLIYLVLPSSVDVDLRLALYSPDTIPPLILDTFASQQITIDVLDSEDALRDKVEDRDVEGGLVIAAGLIDQIEAGESTELPLYFSANAPAELSDAMTVLVSMVFNDISNQLNVQPLDVQLSVEVLGYDFEGESLPLRQRLLPMLAVFMLITETLGLASLFAEERAQGTLHALLVTPVHVNHVLLAKGIFGVGLAFIQVMIVMLVTGALGTQPLLIICALLLGSFLVTGIGFLLASTGKDMLSIMGWAMLAYLLLTIPSIGLMFPGTSAGWIKILPSYYLVDTMHRVVNYDAGWSDVSSNLLTLLVYSVSIMGLGTLVLRRKLS